MKAKVAWQRFTLAGLFCLLMILTVPLNSFAKNPEQIFQWVAGTLNVKETLPQPSIQYLDKPALQKVFKDSNKASYQKWEKKLGEVKANQIMQRYLDEILGLFDPKSKLIYVGKFIEPCARDAVLAHEMVHYFQVVLDLHPDASHGLGDPGEMHFLREMEAYGIEKRYRRMFCAENSDNKVAAAN